jgi:hypothetical protein
MAWSTVETKIANPAARVRRKGKKNMAKAKRHMSAKQIRHFGTKRQKAALKAKRHSKHRKRTNAAPRKRARAAPRKHHRKRTNAAPRKHHRKRAAAAAPVRRRRKKTNSSHRPRRKKNPELVSFLLGNSAKRRKKTVASTRRRRKKSAASRSNAGTRRRVSKKGVRHHSRRRRNPGILGIGKPMDWVMGGAGALAGFVGSAAIPSFLGPTTNTGMTGYALAAASTIGLAVLAHMMLPRMPAVAVGVASGGFANLLRRIITDQTPYGAYLNAPPAAGGMGMGDYMVANWGPPRMSDGLHSAMAEAAGTPWSGGGMLTTSSGISTQDMVDIRSSRPC